MDVNMNNFASLCILAYKRPKLLNDSIRSLHETIDYPCEIIINYDGLDNVADFAPEGFVKCSKQILVYGKNRGVGRSLQNCLGLCEGDYIFKIDADLMFKPKWLSSAINILTDKSIAAVGLFDYNKWDPNDDRFKPENNVIEDRGDYKIVKDFVSSIYGFRKDDIDVLLEEAPCTDEKGNLNDDGLHSALQTYRGKLALKDMVENTAFGNKSVYVTIKPDGTAFKTATYDQPLLFKKDLPRL